MSDWVKCTDELPDSPGTYLLTLGDGGLTAGYFDSWREWCPTGVYATYDGCGTVAFDATPTHWMVAPDTAK
jgi:hypothetical protein